MIKKIRNYFKTTFYRNVKDVTEFVKDVVISFIPLIALSIFIGFYIFFIIVLSVFIFLDKNLDKDEE